LPYFLIKDYFNIILFKVMTNQYEYKNSSAFWIVMLHNLETAQNSEEAYWLHLMGQRGCQARNHLLPVGFLLGVLFNPEDGDDIFLQNAGDSQNYTPLQPRRLYS
jgi:hypothetical protein